MWPEWEDERLGAAAVAGDVQAREALVRSNLALAALIALKARPPELPELDAIQEAVLLLQRLVDQRDGAPVAATLPAVIHQHFRSLRPPGSSTQDLGVGESDVLRMEPDPNGDDEPGSDPATGTP